jgi:hypothetical protein
LGQQDASAGQPIDCLTEEDRETFCQYVESYCGCSPESIEKVLSRWSKAKGKDLFGLLGKNLRKKVKLVYEKPVESRVMSVGDVYSFIFFPETKADVEMFEKTCDCKFVFNLVMRVFNLYWAGKVPKEDVEAVHGVLGLKNAAQGFVSRIDGKHALWAFSDPERGTAEVIRTGTKFMRAVRKLASVYGLLDTWEYKDFHDRMSTVTTGQTIDATLVLSIHPMDYLTMSDNAHGWTTCLSVSGGTVGGNGGHRSGVVEAMNSDNLLLAYVESEEPYTFNGHDLPNMVWRVFLSATKCAITAGNPYPYKDNCLVKRVLEFAEDAAEGYGWTYSSNVLPYKDLLNRADGEGNVVENGDIPNVPETEKDEVLYYTYGLYNDLAEFPDNPYWCVRNPVQKTEKVCLSGPATCLACGRLLERNYKRPGKRVGRETMYCKRCESSRKCKVCGQIHPAGETELLPMFLDYDPTNPVGLRCVDELLYHTDGRFFVTKETARSSHIDDRYLIPANQEVVDGWKAGTV